MILVSHNVVSRGALHLKSRRSREAYLEHYRQTVTRPTMDAAERILAKHRGVGSHLDSVPLVTSAVIGQLQRASQDFSRVVPYIHDLWSDGVFELSRADNQDTAVLLNNGFLKPLADFSKAERQFEETLAAMDLCTLTAVARNMGRSQDASAGQSPRTAISLLARMAACDAFVCTVMRPIHENWLRACRVYHRDGTGIQYEELNDFHLGKLYSNARADILGVLLWSVDAEST